MSKGLRHNPLADIELIKQNLKDRYPSPGFPILKELLQNAEDSSAKLVHFAWTRGIELAEHPLLRGPALIAVNDGEFTPDDREAIRQMGLSDKLRAGASIGKFGLGLKSVFYLCEAFLYVAQTTGDPAPEGDILNPWSGEPGSGYSFHAEWDDFSPDDRHRIVDHLGSFLNSPQWFCLWIPLRQKVHCGEIDPIEPLYLGDIPGVPAFLTAHSLSQSFSTALPLLVNVERIKVSLQLAGGQFEPELDMQLLPGAHRRKYRRKYDLNQVMALGLVRQPHLTGMGGPVILIGHEAHRAV